MTDAFQNIRLVIMDLDGVLTNGKLLVHPDGNWIRQMDIKDGYAIQFAVKSGLHLAVISGSSSVPVKQRMASLGVELFFENEKFKSERVLELMKKLELTPEQTLFIGDDIPDLDAFEVAGLKACPVDAVQEVKSVADYISPFQGGNGCVRDILEKVLRIQGKWVVKSHISSL
jgi:3-deoxy-D-manno-octulosonate 8-phosphate phosphatase (KDO 8-P phosphatase)